MEEITIKAIYSDVIELARETAVEQQISVETAMTELLLDYLKQEGIATSPELIDCYDKNATKEFGLNYYKVNAFDYSEETGVLDLFITYLINKDDVSEFTKARIQACHNALCGFFNRCVDNNQLAEEYRESNPDEAEVIDMINGEYKKKNIKQIRLVIMSNGVIKSDYEAEDDFYLGAQQIPTEVYVWDIEATRQSEIATVSNPTINVDLESMFQPLECIPCEETPEVKSYLAIMPAMVLAQIYHKYRARLLNQNVRNFLGGRKKHNKNMLDTIRTKGNRFFAYNNGISSTASKVVIDTNEEGRLVIKSMNDWQIVNGGQTTNVIYYIYSQKKDRDYLNSVNVALKVTEIKIQDEKDKKSAISDIARYANSQQQVKDSDFAVNEPYMHMLKDLSLRESAPQNSVRKGTKWFFVRMRGEYEDAKMSLSIKKYKLFTATYPKNQVLEKTDVAMLEMAWLLLPYVSCTGGEKCFDKFWKTVMDNKELIVDEKYYHRLIAKAIINQRVKDLFIEKGGKGYYNIIQYYVLSIIAMRSHGKFDLDYVWDHQDIQPLLVPIIGEAINIVAGYIQTLGSDVNQVNISSAAKKADFWKAINLRINKIPEFDSTLLVQKVDTDLTNSQKEQLSEFNSVSSDEWSSLALWGRTSRKLSLLERKKVEHIAVAVSKDKPVSFENAFEVMEIYSKAKAMGWH